MTTEIGHYINLTLLFTGLFLLLIGFLLKKRRESHFILLIGWIVFGLFWLIQVPHYIEIGDIFNASFCFLGFLLFLYFTYHEILNIKWNEYVYTLNYIAGVVAVAGLFYYLIKSVSILAKGLIYVVAVNSVWVLKLFGVTGTLGEFVPNPITNEYSLPINGTGIGIILACTGIQSIAIFVGALIVTRSNRPMWVPWSMKFLTRDMPEDVKRSNFRSWLWVRKKNRVRKVLKMTDRRRFFYAFMATIPVIYLLNIFRNAAIMWGTKFQVLGPNTFEIAHNYLSKVLSLVVLMTLLFIIFELLPECLEGVMGIMDLSKRTKRGMVKDGLIELEEPGADKPDDNESGPKVKKDTPSKLKKSSVKTQKLKQNKKLKIKKK